MPRSVFYFKIFKLYNTSVKIQLFRMEFETVLLENKNVILLLAKLEINKKRDS